MRFARLAAPATLVLALLAPPLAAEAQSAGKAYRIALVHPNARVAGMTEVKNPYFKVLFSELRRLGYVEGQNLVVERRSGYGRPARFPEFAREVVQLQPDLILLFSSRLAHAFKAATTTIPLVGITGDPILDKLVTSVARPGGNLTGFSTDTDESPLGKPLELLKGVVPNVTLSAPTTPDWGPVRPSRRKSVVRQPPWDPTEQGLYIRPLGAEAGDREQDRLRV